MLTYQLSIFWSKDCFLIEFLKQNYQNNRVYYTEGSEIYLGNEIIKCGCSLEDSRINGTPHFFDVKNCCIHG